MIIFSFFSKQTLNGGLWYRALIQVILVEIYGLKKSLEDIKLGKLIKKSLTFEEYVWKALDRLKLDKTKVKKFCFFNLFNNKSMGFFFLIDHIGCH